MRYQTLGGTGLLVSEICLGTMTFGGPGAGIWSNIGQVGQADADAIVARALDAGVNFIDTADVYSGGLSEEITGRAMVNSGRKRTDIVLATKCTGATGTGPNDRGSSRGHIMDSAKASPLRPHSASLDSDASASATVAPKAPRGATQPQPDAATIRAASLSSLTDATTGRPQAR